MIYVKSYDCIAKNLLEDTDESGWKKLSLVYISVKIINCAGSTLICPPVSDC